MFLRSLYGSRMPQPLHPRVDPHASSYWEEDTATSREIVRAMEEAEASDADLGDDDKKTNSVLLTGDNLTSRRRSNTTLSSHFAELLGIDDLPLQDVDHLCVENMGSSPVNTQLSPAGLISIAAADIDEAANNNNQNVPPLNGQLDLAYIRSLRQESIKSGIEENITMMTAALRQVVETLPAARTSGIEEVAVEIETNKPENNFFSLIHRHFRMLKISSFLALKGAGDVQEDAADCQTKMRFLSLLRRINELCPQHSESWDGLPYPQIIALPTFEYQNHEHHADNKQPGEENGKYNLDCAVCRDEFKAKEEVRALPCLHFYHRECIDQWLMCHRQCPICKHVVVVH
ncbi:ring finger ubiquitin [Plasmopara halstedii]|uniref:Ring finger ubiquitin n=1 Tax=Plasmopara halstedii TaxID=4781 RepID=A0A0P1ABL9_PLAHL|nr:ring finger ubiquitin [Plasmopara halstedii]CEG38252.1 ring finger ubiquitin [Plasmopara halstedii]|eukprot:XP_024574621.1 ring finger ubiquitin [Plasmopara halstedii]